MKRLLLVLICLTSLVCRNCFAEATAMIGAGKGITGEPGTPFERVAVIGYQHAFSPDFFARGEIGKFEDYSGNGKSSAWITPIFGIKAVSKMGPELHVGAGPGYLHVPDNILGGHFQFFLEGGLGIASYDGHSYVGIAWKHISSAGIETPNKGRDFIVVQVRVM